MFPVKSEPPDTYDVSKDSQRIRPTDDNPHISDTSNINTDNFPDKNHSEEMFLTIAYVGNESISNSLDINNWNSKGNKDIHGQHLIDISHINTEKKWYIDKTPGAVTDEEHGTVKAKVES